MHSSKSGVLLPPHIEALKPYEPGLTVDEIQRRFGLDRVIKLASNENPLGVSPRAMERIRESLTSLNRYPAGGLTLRRELADRFGMKIGNVIVGPGSEGVIASIVRAFLHDDDEVLTTEAAFLGFQLLARSRGVPYRTVPYKDWHYDLTAMAEAITPRTKVIYLANPNNPTGTFFTKEEFEAFYHRVPPRVLIILDEAYYEFATERVLFPDSLHYRFDNVITLRTFSKAFGLASARIGYGFAHEDLISVLLRVKLAFEPSGPAEAAALGALEDDVFLQRSVANNAEGLALFQRELPALGYAVAPSAANFVMITLPDAETAEQTFQGLLRRGVIVRPLRATGLAQCLRVSVGTPEENQAFLDALVQVRSELAAARETTGALP